MTGKSYDYEHFKLDEFKRSICNVYCGNNPLNCKRDCNIKKLTASKARNKTLAQLFNFRPSEKANEMAREIRLQEEYQKTKKRKDLKQ